MSVEKTENDSEVVTKNYIKTAVSTELNTNLKDSKTTAALVEKLFSEFLQKPNTINVIKNIINTTLKTDDFKSQIKKLVVKIECEKMLQFFQKAKYFVSGLIMLCVYEFLAPLIALIKRLINSINL